ncbi:TAXI family TRAP transporter solute-binding subunit [Planococcus sp. 107-1]|uniref:TAXI family TRAP transporter solute-binding subunit n=1 Tax=Planococcus sp. 107-1 TaxID=2908840 RepID=UPI001F36285A|nr:TAXI family TRAP transporter solute-binding subunit [Planococcus sp. 107-1]UJF25927.1 TAXI family TRAP transporter solute-binding subunit [Planococcus sp. 107-1]
MLKKKFGLFAAVALAGSVFLAGCGDDTASDSGDGGGSGGSADPEFLSILTGGTTGTYYPLGGAMATIIENETGIDTTAEVSQASAANMTALADGDAQIAFVQTDTAFYAAEGSNMFEGEVIDTVSAIGALYPETIQLVTTANSGITSFDDLAGKSISVGAPGSGTYINAEQLLEIHGMTMEDIEAQNLDFGESQESLQAGQIDAAFITAGTPTGAVESLSATSDVVIVPVAEDKAAELIEKYPYYATDTVPSGTYGLTEDVPTVSVLAMLVVQNDLSEDLVYDMTKAIYENTDQIQHAKAAFIKPETALDGIGIDVHPGAQKYFDEANQ